MHSILRPFKLKLPGPVGEHVVQIKSIVTKMFLAPQGGIHDTGFTSIYRDSIHTVLYHLIDLFVSGFEYLIYSFLF